MYFDCPVPPCYIDKYDFQILRNKGIVSIYCVPKAFIMWNLNVTHCYSTVDWTPSRSLSDFKSIADLKDFSRQVLSEKCKVTKSDCETKCPFYSKELFCGCPSYSL